MEESNPPGRNTPGVGSKPSTPVPQPPPSGNASGPLPPSSPSSMPQSSMAPIPTSHGASRYGYPVPNPQMHPHGPYGSMGGPQSNHPGMSHHSYPPGSYGPGHQMHPQQAQHGGPYGIPMMMPPPSQYPNKPPMSHVPNPSQPPPPSVSPGAPPSPHSSMMGSDRSSMSYGYGSRMPGGPPPHHGPPPSPHQQSPYYLRPQMSPHQSGKNYYGSNVAGAPTGPYGGHGPGSMMVPGQHMPHHQQQPHHPHHPGGPMMMHHHPGMTPQMQQAHGGSGHYGMAPGSHMSESSAPTGTTTSVTHTSSSHSSGTTNHSSDNLRHPQPPSIMDEVSQTSTASSQAADDSCASTDMPTSHKSSSAKHHLSHPSTPNTSNLGSPGAASLSSFHDDFDSVSSPSWPRTPASPALNSSQYETHVHTKRPDSVQKLYEISDEPERKLFLDKYLSFQEERGSPLSQVPTISKIPVDLFRLYLAAKERGGFVDVTHSKLWKECANICNIANSSSAAYTLRKQYIKHLLPFECKFDRGGIDPALVLSSLENSNSSSRKKASSKNSGSGQSTPTSTPRLSPSDSSGPTYHSMPQGAPPHSNFEMDQQHPGYPPNSMAPTSAGAAGQHSGYLPHPQAQYHHSGYPYSHGANSGHMPPPPPPQHPMIGQGMIPTPPAQSQPSTPAMTVTNHESVSVKDPFADDEQSSSTSAPSSSSNPSPTFPGRPHYSMSSSGSGPYYNQIPPSAQPQSQQAPPHPGAANYPDVHSSHQPPAHYPDGQYPRPSGTSNTPDAPGNSQIHPQYPGYSSRMSSAANGPAPHGYYAPGQPQPGPSSSQPAQPPQQMPYDQQPPHSRSPYDSHSQRPMTPANQEHFPPQPHHHSPHTRYPMPSSASHPPANSLPVSSYGPTRGLYSSSSAPHHTSSAPVSVPPPSSSHHSQSPQAPQQSIPPPSQSPQQPPNFSTPPPPSSQENYGKNSEAFNSALRMQSPLAQRLLAAKVSQNSSQAYSGSQPIFTTPPTSNSGPVPQSPQAGTAKSTAAAAGPLHSSSSAHYPSQGNSNISWMSPSSPRYSQPKRHPDFLKQTPENYHSHPYSQSPYSNYPGTPGGPRSIGPGTPGPGQPGWNRESNQYRMSAPYMPGHPGYSSGTPHSSSRESWHDSRPPVSTSSSITQIDGQSANHWPSSRFSGYPIHEYGASHSHFSHSQHSKMMNSGLGSGYGSSRHDQPGSRSGYMMHSHSGHHSSKMPMPMMSSNHPSSSHPLHSSHGSYGGYPPASSMPAHMMPAHQAMNMRRDIIFPPNSVEATVPNTTKRRKLTSRDITPVEAWRLYMALKSGLLAESSFALDVLNVYSNDDATLIYLGLSNMPGLLEVLLEHYKCYLNEMFDCLFDDTEIGYEAKQLRYEIDSKFPNRLLECAKEGEKKKRVKKWYELSKDLVEEDEAEIEEVEDDDEELNNLMESQFKTRNPQQLVLLNTTNYTHVTRTGKPVKYKKTKSLFIEDFEKKWDFSRNGFQGGNDHWSKGGGETTSHIESHLEPKENYLRLVRVIKSDKKKAVNKSLNGFVDPDKPNTNDENAIENNNNNNMDVDDVELIEQHDRSFGELDEQAVDDDIDKQSRKRFLTTETQYPKIREIDRERYWKQLHQPEFEEESYDQEEPTVSLGRDYQDSIKSRCLTVSNLIRNLTFVPGNEVDMCKHPGLLLVLSRLILLHHIHALKKKRKPSDIDCTKLSSESMDDNTLFNLNNDDKEKTEDEEKLTEKEWWWDSLHILRENTLVTLANLSGQLDLSPFPEQISLTILDGLIHWATCPSSYAQDSLPAAHSTLSPKRLSYEALSKLSIYESNVDLILATPPWSRMENFFLNLSRSLGRHEEQTMREFSIVLLSNFAGAEASTARAIALIGNTIQLLISFIEQSEQSAMHIANTQGVQVLRENPELMGTTLDMIRRTASTLRHLARVVENRTFFIQYEQRLLSLVMSQILDQSVASIVADILYECSSVSSRDHSGTKYVSNSSDNNNNNQNNSQTEHSFSSIFNQPNKNKTTGKQDGQSVADEKSEEKENKNVTTKVEDQKETKLVLTDDSTTTKAKSSVRQTANELSEKKPPSASNLPQPFAVPAAPNSTILNNSSGSDSVTTNSDSVESNNCSDNSNNTTPTPSASNDTSSAALVDKTAVDNNNSAKRNQTLCQNKSDETIKVSNGVVPNSNSPTSAGVVNNFEALKEKQTTASSVNLNNSSKDKSAFYQPKHNSTGGGGGAHSVESFAINTNNKSSQPTTVHQLLTANSMPPTSLGLSDKQQQLNMVPSSAMQSNHNYYPSSYETSSIGGSNNNNGHNAVPPFQPSLNSVKSSLSASNGVINSMTNNNEISSLKKTEENDTDTTTNVNKKPDKSLVDLAGRQSATDSSPLAPPTSSPAATAIEASSI